MADSSKLLNDVTPSILECIERVKDAGYIVNFFKFDANGSNILFQFCVSNN